MRDIVKVIDAVLAEIPDEPKWTEMSECLEASKGACVYMAPECAAYFWYYATNPLLRLLPKPPVEPWQQRIADIWSGRTEVSRG